MAHHYFYTPCYHGPVPDADTGEPTSDTVKSPGIDSGSGAEYLPQLPPGTSVLKYDDGVPRCVVRSIYVIGLPGWVPKTSGEIITDYPELSGAV